MRLDDLDLACRFRPDAVVLYAAVGIDDRVRDPSKNNERTQQGFPIDVGVILHARGDYLLSIPYAHAKQSVLIDGGGLDDTFYLYASSGATGRSEIGRSRRNRFGRPRGS
jgi:hypothetical protein